MGKEDVLTKRFKHSGAYHWRNFVSTIKQWGEERGFDVIEKVYKEKVPEIELTLLGERKRDEYLAEYFQVSMHLWAVRDLPEPKGYIESRGEYMVTSWIETGYVDLYDNRPMLEGWMKKADEFFKRHVLKMRLQLEVMDPFYYEMLNLVRTMQHAAGMEMALTRREEET